MTVKVSKFVSGSVGCASEACPGETGDEAKRIGIDALKGGRLGHSVATGARRAALA